MRVKIFQINPSRDTEKVRFKDVKNIETVNPEIYDKVFDAVIDESDPSEIMSKINTDDHPLYMGKVIAASDVISVEDKSYICQNEGFKEIDFDGSAAYKLRNLMRVVYKEPKKPAFETEIRDDLHSMQKAVGGGLIETVKISDDETILIDNEESKLMGMEGNIHFGDGTSIIAGPFFICGEKNCDFRGLTEAEAKEYLERFSVPEEISQEEAESDMGYQIIGFNFI